MDQYIGKDSTLEGIETISGTTISSNAFSKACLLYTSDAADD